MELSEKKERKKTVQWEISTEFFLFLRRSLAPTRRSTRGSSSVLTLRRLDYSYVRAACRLTVASDETAIVLVSGSHKKNCEEGEGVVP